MQDYSQNGEQQHILRIFGDFVGRFLEIGACDGKLVSNTLALVEHGWSGVMVEPSPRAFVALQERHGDNPRLTLIHAAIGLDDCVIPFWDDPTIGGYATTEEGNRAKWQHLAGFAKQPFYVPSIPVSRFAEVESLFSGPFDFVSIDTEGTSTDLFLAFPLGVIRPKVICVEHDGRIPECLARAQKFGYREVTRNGENLLFMLG